MRRYLKIFHYKATTTVSQGIKFSKLQQAIKYNLAENKVALIVNCAGTKV